MADIRKDVTEILFSERESEIKHPSYAKEMSLYDLIADGKLEKVKYHLAMDAKPNAVERGVLSDNPLRNAIYHMVAMTAVLTRICIRRGMPEDFAYKMSDAYIKKCDSCSTVDAVLNLQYEMVEEYTIYMRENATQNATSKQIKECVNYIRAHIHDNITVSELADVVALNETYLSKLFKKEMKCTVSEYIRNEKIEEACWLLSYTDKSSIEIATDLSFSSHSYFISVFKKVKKVTPKEYRNSVNVLL
ncbi:MAG: AraC family transcriptional regulator [Eubacterium sp.]|nr:AraC family transcriptional regulator [Eubacterium sp.]